MAQEFIIGGWVQEAGRHFKGVLVGVHGPKGLTYVGTLERGFSAEPGLLKRLQPLETKTNPFKVGDPPRADVRWVEPSLVAQAEFQEWTDSGKIRHASFRASEACATTRTPVRFGERRRSRHQSSAQMARLRTDDLTVLLREAFRLPVQ